MSTRNKTAFANLLIREYKIFKWSALIATIFALVYCFLVREYFKFETNVNPKHLGYIESGNSTEMDYSNYKELREETGFSEGNIDSLEDFVLCIETGIEQRKNNIIEETLICSASVFILLVAFTNMVYGIIWLKKWVYRNSSIVE